MTTLDPTAVNLNIHEPDDEFTLTDMLVPINDQT
jgi:hypothetical protein